MSVSVVETISTHTLTWSVTASEDYCKGRHCISTHTLTWSVTKPAHQFLALLRDFNSHAHVERDVAENAAKVAEDNFNSHAHVERDQSFISTPVSP